MEFSQERNAFQLHSNSGGRLLGFVAETLDEMDHSKKLLLQRKYHPYCIPGNLKAAHVRVTILVTVARLVQDDLMVSVKTMRINERREDKRELSDLNLYFIWVVFPRALRL